MKAPGTVTGCTNTWHTHAVDVMANLANMQQCTFARPEDTIVLTLNRELAERFVTGDDDDGEVRDKIVDLLLLPKI